MAEITLKNHRQIDFARFQQAMQKVDEIIECHLISGGYDYLLKFVTAGISDYQEIMEQLAAQTQNWERISTVIIRMLKLAER